MCELFVVFFFMVQSSGEIKENEYKKRNVFTV